MLVSIVAVVLAAAAFALVGYPLLRQRREQSPEVMMPDEYELALEDLTAQRDSTYSAIKELDFDQEMGNLPEADYRELRDRYRRKAATILRDLDGLRDGAMPATRRPQAEPDAGEEAEIYAEDDIEREILRRRRRRSQIAGPSQGAPDRGRRSAQSHRACPSCGTHVAVRDRFCPRCGTHFATGCPNCGAPRQPDDRFCARCGGTLAEVAAR